MSNFPSKWFDFTNHKELKRLRHDITDTFELKMQVAISLIVAIISFYLDGYVCQFKPLFQMLFCIALCLIILLIFILPYVIKKVSIRMRSGFLIKGKDAVSVFDDEIVYNILVACEYFNGKKKIPDGKLKNELESFYTIEIQYYVTESVKKLFQFTSNNISIFGDGKNQISIERVKNIVALIDALIESSDISLEDSIKNKYSVFCEMVKK